MTLPELNAATPILEELAEWYLRADVVVSDEAAKAFSAIMQRQNTRSGQLVERGLVERGELRIYEPSELKSWVEKHGTCIIRSMAIRDEGSHARCYCCGQMRRAQGLIAGVGVGDCCWADCLPDWVLGWYPAKAPETARPNQLVERDGVDLVGANALPAEYARWLSSIEVDVRVHDLTADEVARLIATLTAIKGGKDAGG